MTDTPNPLSLKVLESGSLVLTLEYKHAFAVWRALECYVEVCMFAQQHLHDVGLKTGVQGMKPLIDVRDLLRNHMRSQLGYVKDKPDEDGA